MYPINTTIFATDFNSFTATKQPSVYAAFVHTHHANIFTPVTSAACETIFSAHKSAVKPAIDATLTQTFITTLHAACRSPHYAAYMPTIFPTFLPALLPTNLSTILRTF